MTQNVRGFVVATQCNTEAEFIERYHAQADDTAIFVGIIEERVLGTECAFAPRLTTKAPVLAGICRVLELCRDADNPYKRPGMRLEIRRLGFTSERVFGDMSATRAANKRRVARGSQPPETDDD